MFGDDEAIRSDKDLAEDYKAGMERQDQLIAMMQADLDAKQAELDRLRAYVEPRCYCPHCETYRHCLAGCAYLASDGMAWKRMRDARVAMWGDEQKGQTNETES